MEGMGIWIFLLLFYLLQAITKNQQKKRRLQQADQEPENESLKDLFNRSTGKKVGVSEDDEPISPKPKKTQEPVSLEDLFNPNKLRDILGVPQPKAEAQPKEEPIPQPVIEPKIESEVNTRREENQQSKPSLRHEKERKTVSTIASADITNVDETAADFKSSRLKKSDITSDRFDTRKEAPGKKKSHVALEYFDEPEDVRNAIVLKEILDRPRAFRRNIR